MTLSVLKKLAEAAPDCFPLSSKGEIQAGVFYDAVRPIFPDLIARLESAEASVKEYIYETTHLSKCEDDGSHKCQITAACLQRARDHFKTWGEV